MKAQALAAILSILVAGCGALKGVVEMPAQRIPVPIAGYSGVAWLPNDWIIVDYRADPNSVISELWRLRSDGSGFARLALPDDPRCFSTRYRALTSLPDGRLGLVQWCLMPPPGPGEPFKPDEQRVMAYDMETEELKPLMAVPVHLGLSQITWNPSLTRGLWADSSLICASIIWLTPDGVEYPTIRIEDNGRAWGLDEQFRKDRADPCDHLGRADLPTWSPDGRTIAFLASPQSIGLSGQARLDAPWNLYLMDPIEQKPRKVLADIKYPRSLIWSPDSRWLAFSGEFAWRGRGTWLFTPDTGALHRITGISLQWVAWSPEGKRIVGVHDLDRTKIPAETELLLFEVSTLLEGR